MSKKVLVIDDHEGDRESIKRLLEELGFEVLTAARGEEGIELVTEYNPDIVCIDTDMPGINGFETCRQIKANQSSKTDIIIMTGKVDAIDVEQARKNGADDYCVKTFDFSELLESVKGLSGSS